MATAGNFPFKAGSSGLAKHSGVALKIDKWCQEAFPLVRAQSLKYRPFPILSLEPSTATLLEYAPVRLPGFSLRDSQMLRLTLPCSS